MLDPTTVLGPPAACAESMRRRVRDALETLQAGRSRLIVPRREGLRQRLDRYFFHANYEFFIQVKGATDFCFPRQRIELKTGDMLVVPPDLPHDERMIRHGGRFLTVVLTPAPNRFGSHLSAHEFDEKPTITYLERFETARSNTSRQLMDQLVIAAEQTEHETDAMLRGIGCAILALALEIYAAPPVLNDLHPSIQQAQRLIESRLHDCNLSLKAIAAELRMSADYLSHLFHKQTGKTMNRRLNELRIERAAELLAGTRYNIAEISYMCGYRTPTYFTRVFTKNHGIPPKAFRIRATSATTNAELPASNN